MTEPVLEDKRRNKNFVIQNRFFLQDYGHKNYEKFGRGIIIINLLLLNTDVLTPDDILNNYVEEYKEITLHQPLSYLPEKNFWFKMIYLKIKNKYQIDIQEQYDLDRQFLIIFIKDASVEHFSIYSLKAVK
jgi:hypothetical protein